MDSFARPQPAAFNTANEEHARRKTGQAAAQRYAKIHFQFMMWKWERDFTGRRNTRWYSAARDAQEAICMSVAVQTEKDGYANPDTYSRFINLVKPTGP